MRKRAIKMRDDSNRLYKMYVGTYSAEGEDSIFLFHLFHDTGKMKLVQGFKGGASPSYFAIDRAGHRLAAVNEIEEFNGRKTGAVSSFLIDEVSGFLKFRNRVSSEGSLPVSITYIRDEDEVIVANYNSGNIAVFPVDSGGSLAGATDTFQHLGSGRDEDRQTSPHAHQIVESPDGRLFYVVDLGLDQIRTYRLESGKLMPAQNPVAYTTTSGWGPRQLVFHPSGAYAFLVHELESIVSALRYNAEEGRFEEVQSLLCIPEDYRKQNKCGGIKLTPDGRFLYVSNRGHNSIAVFSVEENSGRMELIEFADVHGDWPREFCLSPDGTILIAANQKSNTLTSFAIDSENGKLRYTGQNVKVRKPVFVMIGR